MKYLPPAIESVANAYDSVQQGLLARENRRQIRRQMEHDVSLEALPNKRRNELAALVDHVLQKDKTLVPKAFRFSKRHVIDVELVVKKGDETS